MDIDTNIHVNNDNDVLHSNDPLIIRKINESNQDNITKKTNLVNNKMVDESPIIKRKFFFYLIIIL